MRLPYHNVLVLALSVAVWGCAANAGHPAKPTSTDAWSSRTREQKFDVMEHSVVPQMGQLFQRFYNDPDVKLTCKGCHGDNAEQVDWRMPNNLPKLDPAHMPDHNEPEAKFMYEQVTPKMREILGLAPYDPKTGEGFGCFACHPRKQRS